MGFLQSAAETDNVAATLSKFVAHVPEDAVNITAVISELFTISASLRSLETLHNSPLRPNFSFIINDVELVVRASLHHTVRVANDFFVAVDDGGGVKVFQQNIRDAWFRLRDYYLHEAGYPLLIRLQYYQKMLLEIVLVIRNEPGDPATLNNLRQAINTLRVNQDRRYAAAAHQRQQQANFAHNARPLNPSIPAPRAIPHAPQPPVPPPAPHAPHPDLRHRPSTPQLKSSLRKPAGAAAPVIPTLKRSYERRRPQSRLQSPHPPGWFDAESPSSSFGAPESSLTADSTSTDSFSFLDPFDHWAVSLFSRLTSATPLPQDSQGSKCHASSSLPNVLGHLETQYDELFRLNFNPNLTAMLYLRDRDHRARIMCQVRISPSKIYYATQPLNKIHITRDKTASYLRLCLKDKSGQLEAWLSLQFDTIEKMILFHCAFIALRGQDSGHVVNSVPDSFTLDEEEFYAGRIHDNGYLHALRIFRDPVTKVIRLQASVLNGDMADVPVWTAFIHEFLLLKQWLRKASPTTVILSQLDRAVFINSDDYIPLVTQHNEHVLTFNSELAFEILSTCQAIAYSYDILPLDVEDFLSRITHLRHRIRRQ
ncbi:uncharacterized protein PADG_00654 [Paracoccidioides brasiliensis Pb18]|uniref:Uncharacterized protein n=1 Tax=Paracoccidioides brasiliensis (strain Pb18) TaxID=502780 RepID=C1G1B4_PARBD|nr:uncharacterized protein PADG_00654 [Paracoccidioides brasiliensis Pb18]EEH44365.2 hypothetical protein PADG_00654 [Paracoccidioides brasiliensis Pb18]